MPTITRDDIVATERYYAQFPRFELQLSGQCILDCTASGDNTAALAMWATNIHRVMCKHGRSATVFEDSVRRHLTENGTWTPEDLTNHAENMKRFITLAISDILGEGVTTPRTRNIEQMEKALRGMLEAWEEQFGEGACDCRPEPENAGHVCQCCAARAALGIFDRTTYTDTVNQLIKDSLEAESLASLDELEEHANKLYGR